MIPRRLRRVLVVAGALAIVITAAFLAAAVRALELSRDLRRFMALAPIATEADVVAATADVRLIRDEIVAHSATIRFKGLVPLDPSYGDMPVAASPVPRPCVSFGTQLQAKKNTDLDWTGRCCVRTDQNGAEFRVSSKGKSWSCP